MGGLAELPAWGTGESTAHSEAFVLVLQRGTVFAGAWDVPPHFSVSSWG